MIFNQSQAAAVTIGYAPGDHAGSVTKNVTLSATGNQGTLITWSSDNGAITTSGTVTRPEAGASDITVTLTATLEKDGNAATKTFTLTVKEKPSSAEEEENELSFCHVCINQRNRGNGPGAFASRLGQK